MNEQVETNQDQPMYAMNADGEIEYFNYAADTSYIANFVAKRTE